ncbi:MAG: PA-phosphatase-like phosphoesterase [Parcubacteria group bacterium Gr01-1014_17]|nr:MAG: PA-phosphatase-like phosphoesterase [Parcubacteria group bacterium Gr01-1014_17]
MDASLFHTLNNLAGQSPVFDAAIIFLAKYFPYAVVLAFLALLFYSGYAKREKIRIFWVTMFSVAIARYGITELIRFFYYRPRPFVAYEIQPLFAEHSWSFPSGHAAFFFALATSLYFYNKKWSACFFLAAILISISRIIAGVHYPSDILGGAFVGIAIAYVVCRITKKSR